MLTFAFMHYPYLVCILFGMPSLHLFTFLMFFKSCYKYSSHCDKTGKTLKKYTYIVASDGVCTDMARIYVLRKKTALSGVSRELLWHGFTSYGNRYHV